MPDYVRQKLAASNRRIISFITDNLLELAEDHPDVSVLFVDDSTDEVKRYKMNDKIKDYPDESTLYVLVNVIYRLVGSNRLDPEIMNVAWERAQYYTVKGILMRNLERNDERKRTQAENRE